MLPQLYPLLDSPHPSKTQSTSGHNDKYLFRSLPAGAKLFLMRKMFTVQVFQRKAGMAGQTMVTSYHPMPRGNLSVTSTA